MWPWLLNRGLFSHSFFRLFWDFDYWSLTRGWPLNGGLTVLLKLIDTQCKIGSKDGAPSFSMD